MTTDVILNQNKSYWDFDWTDSGDISTNDTLDTSILISIFEEKRASPSEIAESNRRRGWMGNESTPEFEQGSKQWLFEQERITGSVLAELGVIIRNALQWLIDDDIAKTVVVNQPTIRNGKVSVAIDIGRDGSKVDHRFYELWDNSGNF